MKALYLKEYYYCTSLMIKWRGDNFKNKLQGLDVCEKIVFIKYAWSAFLG